MCNLYEPAPREKINPRHLVTLPAVPYGTYVAPLLPGPIVMARGASAVGQWGMIPADSKSRTPMTREGKRMSTNNARTEGMAKAWTYRFPWSRGQRCLIPAESFQEPYWGPHDAPFAKSIAWRFERADGQPWALAGLWSEWADPATGELVPNFTMILVGVEVT